MMQYRISCVCVCLYAGDLSRRSAQAIPFCVSPTPLLSALRHTTTHNNNTSTPIKDASVELIFCIS